jgi:formylglycine-generating enzyme required for sulfatase activity
MKPQKLFISYPSESWNFAQRIAENLAPRLEQSLFIDYRSIDQVDFAESILSHLRDSDAVLLMVTEFTFADIHRDHDWLRLEIRTALEAGIPIVLVRENGALPPNDLPDDVRAVNRSQGVPFYREFFAPGIDMLCEFLIRIGVGTARTSGAAQPIIQPTPPPTAPVQPEPQRTIGGQGSIEEAMDLLDEGDYEKADFLLRALDRGVLRELARRTVDDLLAHADTLRQAAERQRGAAQDYDLIAAKAKRKLTEAAALQEFAAWAAEFPDLVEALDSANLRQLTPSQPADPFHAALQRARSFAGKRNRDWQPFIATFADLKLPDMPFCLVPVGSFQMGSSDGKYSDEEPVHSQTFARPYWIAQYPVTNAQWVQAVGAGAVPQPLEAGSSLKWYRDPGMADAPVVGVTWFMARDFAAWLGCRLPTEAEWEYAARGVESWRYPWGDEWEDGRRVIWDKTSGGKPNPVTSKAEGVSWVGGQHLIGNVWEWTSSLYQPYPYQPEDGRERDIGNSTDVRRVLRGGSWFNLSADFLRAACRNDDTPDNGLNDWGFRVARSS